MRQEMLVNVKDDFYLMHCKDDPVRPHIPLSKRIEENKEVYALTDDFSGNINAMICVAYTNDVPTTEYDLDNKGDNVAVFYTVWSYAKGCGRLIVNDVAKHIKNSKPNVKRYVTLSPQTEMAEKFHLSNGATKLQTNPDTVNFEYFVD